MAMTGGGNPQRWAEPPPHQARPASGPLIDDGGGQSQPAVAEPQYQQPEVTSGVTTVETSVGTEASITAQVSTHKPDNTQWQRGDPEPPPPWQELMPSALETRLLALTVVIDQMAAEYRDPNVGRRRRQQIHDYCEKLYIGLKNVEDVDVIEQVLDEAAEKPPEQY